jgi:hypothetical protein
MSKPPFYKTVDTLFHSVMDRNWVPKYFKENPGISAAVLGATGTTAVLEATQHFAEAFLPQFYATDFSKVEGLCAAGLTFAIGYLGVTRKLEEWAKNYPVYTPGMIGVVSSAYVVALADLLMK